MEKIIFVEILSRRGHVRERFKLSSFPATAGRAYTNDIILDDPFVSPVHFQIDLSPEGEFLVRDLGTPNGIYPLKSRKRTHEVKIGSGVSFRVGQTLLRLRTPDFAVPPAIADQPSHGLWVQKFNSAWAALISFFSVYVFSLLEMFYFTGYEEINASTSGISAIGLFIWLLVFFVIYSGIFSGFSRQNRGRYFFWGHLTRVCLGFLAVYLFATINEFLAFSFGIEHIFNYTLVAGICLLAFFVLYANMRLCTRTTPRRLSIIIGTVCLLSCISITLLVFWDSKKFKTYPSYSSTLKPPAFQWVQDSTPDEFFSRMPALKQKADRLRDTQTP